jgi:hypothetical protein
MSLWRREAIQRFPEMHWEIADADSVMYVWNRLFDKLQDAYCKEPRDDSRIAAIYDYALWSLKHRSIEVRTQVVINFFEQLHDDPKVRRDLPQRISQEDFDLLGFAWEYGTKQKFEDLQQEFVENKARIEKENRTRKPHHASG